MPKFITYDPSKNAPAFSDRARIEIETRDGRVMVADEPWMLAGWNHTGGRNDILSFRLLRGTMTPQKPIEKKVEMTELEKDARIFTGLPPYRRWSNASQGNPSFDTACRAKYGDKVWADAVRDVVEREDAIIAEAEAITQVNEIAARRGLPILHADRDSNVELKALLKEVVDVLHCHHRNTHKPLLERVRKLRSQL